MINTISLFLSFPNVIKLDHMREYLYETLKVYQCDLGQLTEIYYI